MHKILIFPKKENSIEIFLIMNMGTHFVLWSKNLCTPPHIFHSYFYFFYWPLAYSANALEGKISNRRHELSSSERFELDASRLKHRNNTVAMIQYDMQE